MQAVVVEALADGGFEPTIARSGEEAATLLREDQDYRTLVTDINSSVTELIAEHAREMEPAFPIGYMTGASVDTWASHGFPTASFCLNPRNLLRCGRVYGSVSSSRDRAHPSHVYLDHPFEDLVVGMHVKE